MALPRLAYPLLAVLCVMLWLPGILSLPALDRDESRFAQSSRQMLDSGNFVDIRFGQVPRYNEVMAASLIIVLPVIALFLFLQRYFVNGLLGAKPRHGCSLQESTVIQARGKGNV